MIQELMLFVGENFVDRDGLGTRDAREAWSACAGVRC
jgi:hypothetical protein